MLTDKRLFWELLKTEIREATISFSKNLTQSTNFREMEITRRIQTLDELICNNFHAPDIDQVLNKFDDLKTIYTKKGNAAIFRSKCRWVENGERPTKYFFNLERRNFDKKATSELRVENEMIIKSKTQVLDAIEKYLKGLYKSASSATRAIR